MGHDFLAMAFPMNRIFLLFLIFMLIHFMVVVQFHVYSKCSVLLDVAENKIPLMYGK